MISYIEAVKHLENLVKQANGANTKLLDKAASLIKRSEDLQEEAYSLIAEAYQSASHNDLELEDSIHGQFVFMNNFDELEEEERAKIKNRENELQKISGLEPSGFTDTDKTLHDYACEIVKCARGVFDGENIIAHVWPYRWGGYSMISCDLFNKGEKTLVINIHAVEQQKFVYHGDLNVLEIEVFDMAEALHLVGIITQALDANIIIGLGRNEVNPAVLDSLLKEGQTNGEINIWKK